MGIRLGRKSITRRMRQLSEMTLRQKGAFLKTCNYLSLSCDESDTFSATAPLAAALQACSPEFLWGNLFVGQTDVAVDKTGKGCYIAVRHLVEAVDPTLWELIVWSCTDGASVMRSTHLYAGLDGKPDGESLHAYMKRNGKPKLPNLHGTAHNTNLAVKYSMKVCGPWVEQWLDHIKAMYNWFKQSPSRKSKLKWTWHA